MASTPVNPFAEIDKLLADLDEAIAQSTSPKVQPARSTEESDRTKECVMQVAVFIDGGYLSQILREFNLARIDYHQFTTWICQDGQLFRAYYYDCLPWQPPNPTREDNERLSRAQSFFIALQRGYRMTVREGRLEPRGYDGTGRMLFQQKRVDMLLGLDIATLVAKNKADMIAIVTGDSDFIPAVELAQREGVLVRLIHGPRATCHNDLYSVVDERLEITRDVIERVRRH